MIQGFSSGLIGNRALIYETDLPSFQRDFASVKTLDHGTGPAITFTRASGATYFDVNGVLQTAANDVARFDHDPATGASRGLLIEEARTNSIRNSQAGGAVAGTPGTLPTNWITTTLPSGISREVVASGTANGFSYVDLKFSGTSTASGFIQIYPESLTQVVASSGQSWTGSLYLALVNGSTSGITDPRINVVERDSGGTALGSSFLIINPTVALQRFSITRTLDNASTACVSVQFNGSVASGQAIDITLRIAAPQLEQGAFATSYIPTTTAAATRSADSAIVTPIASFYNQSEGTLFAEVVGPPVFVGRDAFTFNDTVAGNYTSMRWAGNTLHQFAVIKDTVAQVSIGGAGYTTSGAIYKMSSVYKVDDFASVVNGTLVGVDSSGKIPTVSRMLLGMASNNIVTLNSHIRKIAYWPKRLTNTLLEQLTT